MSVPQLRAVTYLCPSVPVELFQEFVDVLEKNTGYQCTLQYEWRTNGSNNKRLDPFQGNLIDLAFMPSAGYISLMEDRNAFMELLPVTPVFRHQRHDPHSAGTYMDVIVHADKLKHGVNEILDLRGCRWACVSEDSLANDVMLDALQKIGENISFFGSAHRTVSHLASVNMVLTKQADVATIDSAALTCNRRFLYNGAKDVVVLTSFGPFAPYAFVINSRLNASVKQKIMSAFEGINCKEPQFERFGLVKFVTNHPDFYDKEKEFSKSVKSEMRHVPYY